MALVLRAIYTSSFTGAGGPGPKTLVGAVVGDQVVNVRSLANATPFTSSLAGLFETIISVNDQIQQVGTVDLSNEDPLAVLLVR